MTGRWPTSAATCSRRSTRSTPGTAPRLYVACGTEDVRLVEGNRRLASYAADRGLDVTTSFTAGEHEWGYWDARIQDVLGWLPLG